MGSWVASALPNSAACTMFSRFIAKEMARLTARSERGPEVVFTPM